MQDTKFFYSHRKDTSILMGKCPFQNQSEQLMTYLHSDKTGENMKDQTETSSFVCRVLYKVNYWSPPNTNSQNDNFSRTFNLFVPGDCYKGTNHEGPD